MFSKLIVAFLFCTSTIANAEIFQINRTIPCDKATQILGLMQYYGESPVWQGKNNKGMYTLLIMNSDSQTWTFIITDGDTACVLDSGKGFIINNSDAPKKEKNKGSFQGIGMVR